MFTEPILPFAVLVEISKFHNSYMDKCDLTDYAILDPQVRHLNDETVLLTYKVTVHDICEGQPVPEHLIINIVFVREKGKWLKVLDSEVPKSESSSDPSEDERTLKQLEQNWLDAYREGDAEKMSRILADDFVGRWGDGSTTDKRGTVEPVRTAADKHSSNQLVERNARIYGDTAVMTGIQTEQSVLEGRDGSGTYSYTDVFVKRRRSLADRGFRNQAHSWAVGAGAFDWELERDFFRRIIA